MRIQGSVTEIQQEIKSFLQYSLGDNYEVVTNYKTALKYEFDIAILRNRHIISVVNVVLGAMTYGKNRLWYESYYTKLRSSGARYLVITDGDEYYVFDPNHTQPKELTGEEFVRSILADAPMLASTPEISEVVDIIRDLAQKAGLKAVSNHLKGRVDAFECDNKSGIISFKSVDEEDLFFRKLLPHKIRLNQLCRYTSIDSMFQLLKNCRQTMCNVLCMNDKSEGFYADRIVYGDIPSVNEKAYTNNDQCFILSLMDESRDDDLTMWRMYGDEARGVCMKYEMKMGKEISAPFYMSKVSYGGIDEEGRPIHKELDFLKELIAHKFSSGWEFKLKRWHIWRVFFKSYYFKEEREVRLLYLGSVSDSGEWIKNDSSQIITFMHLFNLEDFPMQISSIKLGPKVSEAEVVKRQIKHMVDCKGLGIDVIKSRIDIYR